MRPAARFVLLVLCALAVMAGGPATASAAHVVLKPVGQYREPVYVTSPRKGRRIFVVERHGRIHVVNRGKRVRRPFLDISKQVKNAYQRGLFSMAFAPGYSRNGRFYVVYVDRDDHVQLDEFRRSRQNSIRAVAALGPTR